MERCSCSSSNLRTSVVSSGFRNLLLMLTRISSRRYHMYFFHSLIRFIQVNETLNNPPQGRSGRSGAGGSNAERLAAAAGAGADDLASLGYIIDTRR